MANYFLINSQVVQFSENKHLVQGHFGTRLNENTLKVDLVPETSSGPSNSLLDNIFQGDTQMKRLMKIQITLPDTCPIGNNTSEVTGIMKLTGQGENHILSKIWSFTNGKATIKWIVSRFGETISPKLSKDDGNRMYTISWETEGLELYRSQKFHMSQPRVPSILPEFSSMAKIENIPMTIINAWSIQKLFQATISIYVVIPESSLSCQHLIEAQRHQKSKQMLEKCIETDVQLVSKDGGLAKCHRAMLAVSSGKLAGKLKMQKGREQVKIMSHLSLECINALLPYIYCMDLSKVTTSVALAVEVLGAAVEYQFLDLVSYIQKFLETKSNSDFSVDEGVRIFVIAKTGLGRIDEEYDYSDQDAYTENSDENLTENSPEGENLNGESEDEGLSTQNDTSEQPSISPELRARGVKRITNGENGNGKRYCTSDEGPVGQYGKNISLLRQNSDLSSANSTGTLESDDHDPAQDITTAGNNTEETSDQKFLEEKAIKIILWYKENNPKALAESNERRKLVRSPELLFEFDNILILALQSVHE